MPRDTHRLFSSPKTLGLIAAPIRNRKALPFIRHDDLAALLEQNFDAADSMLESMPTGVFLEIAKHLLSQGSGLELTAITC